MLNTKDNRINNNINMLLMQIVIIVTVFSQIREFEFFIRPLMYIAWGVLFIHVIYGDRGVIRLSNFVLVYIFLYSIYVIYCGVLSLLGYCHINSNYIRLMVIPLMVMITVSQCEMKRDMTRIIFTYLFATVALSLYIHIKYIGTIEHWKSSEIYLVVQKNSLAQIICSAIISSYFILLKDKMSAIVKAVVLLTCIYLLLVLWLSQCRTAILAIVLIVLYNFIFNAKHKFIYILFFTAIVILCLCNKTISTFLEKALGLNNYIGADLDKFSSGRLSLYKQALNIFMQSPIIGVGQYYVDCSYLSILCESGIIGFILIEGIWGYRVILNFRYGIKNKDRYGHLMISLTIFYLIESLLEAFPPFGPGVASFMFWTICSIMEQ